MRIRLCIAALGLGSVAGCASETPPSAPATAPVVSASPIGETPAEVPSAPPGTPAEPFQPPYPNRTELFIPPDLSLVARAPASVDGPNVAVRGFMNLEGQRAVLEINGAVHILKEGEQHAGIEVISIAPPRVVLQRRGERWTAQLLRGR